MTMKDVHALECPQCKIRDQFYEEFNSDSKKNVSYFGVISYLNNYLFLPVSSTQHKQKLSESNYKKVCFFQLINEWTTKDLIAKSINENNGLINQLKKETSRQRNLKTPSFYLPDHAGNLITIKKSESFTESSLDDTICSSNLKPTKNGYECKQAEKCSSEEKVESSPDDTIYSSNLKATKNVYKCKPAKKRPSKEKVESSPGDTICSSNLKATKNVYNCKPAKKCPSKGKVACKEPKKGTLKRKRKNLKKLKDSGSYEDDVFEGKKIKSALPIDTNNSDDEKVKNSPVWTIQVSPIVLNPSYSHEDCYNLLELQNTRKEAEQYQYRRNKRKFGVANKKGNDSTAKMKQNLETGGMMEYINEVINKQEKDDGDSEKDIYFSDSEDSNT